MACILIIDDDVAVCEVLARMLRRMAHEAVCAHTLRDGMQLLGSGDCDVVLLDVNLPDGNGLDLLPDIRTVSTRPEVIIITAEGDPDGAELAIKNGAWDYIEKPATLGEMKLPVMRALQYRDEKRIHRTCVALKRGGIIGSSPQMGGCLDLVAQAAASDAPVLISGETGTGKELFAFAIHENSSRLNNNFVVVDCASLPGNLVESALFGYKKGAFTGADRDVDGLVKQADRGTLFLDEVGELPVVLQKSFLRVLQEHRFRPVGSKTEVRSDFRVIAATNRDLHQMVSGGQFRNDLLFRLESLAIEIPPLKNRQDDIKELTVYYVNRLCERYGIENKGFTPEFFQALRAYDWPGNVRELINTIESALSAARHDPTLFARHLPYQLRVKLARDSLEKKPRGDSGRAVLLPDDANELPSFQEFRAGILENAQRQYLQHIIKRSGGDVKKACRLSGLSRTRLYAVLKDYGLSLREQSGPA